MGTTWDWADLRDRSRLLAARYARRGADIDDIVQLALLRAWLMRDTCRAPERPWPWVRQIVLNEALRQRSARREDPVGDALEELAADDLALDRALRRVDVQRAQRALSHRDLQLIWLRYEADQTQAAIAAQLGIAEGTVKVRLHRARRTLRTALTQD